MRFIGNVTNVGVAKNIEVVVHYIESWLRGEGGCPLNGILEDLATAEITRVIIAFGISLILYICSY